MGTSDQEIGEAVRRQRGRTVSQESLAQAMVRAGHEQWTQTTVSAVEKGARSLRLAEAASMAVALGCDITALLGEQVFSELGRLGGDVGNKWRLLVTSALDFNDAREQLWAFVKENEIDLDSLPRRPFDHELRIWNVTAEQAVAGVLKPDGGEVGITFTRMPDSGLWVQDGGGNWARRRR